MRLRRLTLWFVEAYEESDSVEEAAAALGVPVGRVRGFARRLRKAGVRLSHKPVRSRVRVQLRPLRFSYFGHN